MNSGYQDFFRKAQEKKGVRSQKPNAASKGNSKNLSVIKKNNKPNQVLMSLLVVGFIVTLGGTYYLDEIEKFLGKIEINIFPKAAAEAVEKPKAEKATNNTTPAEKQASPEAEKNKQKDAEDVELNHFARLKERKEELDKREEELTKIETELNLQRAEVDKKLKELETVRRDISSVLENQVRVDAEKVDNLIQFYSNMKPPQAAKIIETIDEDLAVQVLSKMKKKNAADIMNLIAPQKAQVLSEKYAGYRK